MVGKRKGAGGDREETAVAAAGAGMDETGLFGPRGRRRRKLRRRAEREDGPRREKVPN